MAGKRDAAELEELTDDEREALEEGEDGEDEGESDGETTADVAKKAAEADAEDDKDAADGDADGDDKSDTDEGEDAAAEDDAEDKAADGDDKAAETDKAERTVAGPKAPDDLDAKLADIDKREDELAEKFDNGELTAKEYNAELRKLGNERFDLKMDVKKVEWHEENRRSTWFEKTVPDFMDEHPHYRDNPTLNAALDAEVRRLQSAAAKAGKDPMAPAILTRADAAIREAFGSVTGKKPKAEAEDKTETDDAKAKAAEAVRKAGKRPGTIKTLKGLPAADGEDTGAGEFDKLDALADKNPEAFEEAFARLPEAERERYLAQQ